MTGSTANINNNKASLVWSPTSSGQVPVDADENLMVGVEAMDDTWDSYSGMPMGGPTGNAQYCEVPGQTDPRGFFGRLMTMFGRSGGMPPCGPGGQYPPQNCFPMPTDCFPGGGGYPGSGGPTNCFPWPGEGGYPNGPTNCFPPQGNGGYPEPGNIPRNPNGVPVRMIEVGENGKLDKHGAQVAEIYGDVLRNDCANVNISILGQGNGLPPGGVAIPNQYKSKADLDQFIDFKGTYVLSQMAKEINGTKSGVVNASLGWTRASTYMDVIDLLKDHPQMGSCIGLTDADLKCVDLSDPKNPRIPDKVKAQVVSYVDNRFAPQDSAYKKALGIYQNAACTAAKERHVSVVVASANDGKYRGVFNTAKLGADTNFLALSDDVISVAAADTHGTPNLNDDTIADFSSYGNARFQPTVAANGVGIQTSYGEVNGTSFASPIVSAVVTRMLQVNPDLSPAQIKAILQRTAVDTRASNVAEGAGMLNVRGALMMARRTAGEAA